VYLPEEKGSIAQCDFRSKIRPSGRRHTRTDRPPNSRKSNVAPEPVGAPNRKKHSERTNEGDHLMADWNPWQTLEMLRRESDIVFTETDSCREPVFRPAFLPGRPARRYPLINLYADTEALY